MTTAASVNPGLEDVNFRVDGLWMAFKATRPGEITKEDSVILSPPSPGPRNGSLQNPLGQTETQKARPPAPSSFGCPLSQAASPSNQRRPRPPTPSCPPGPREAQEWGPQCQPRPFRDWAPSSATRGLPGLWAGPCPRLGGAGDRVLKLVGHDPRPGTRRRLRGARARLAQRRGRGPGGPQSAPRNPRVSRGERSHCPSQTVKKLLEEQRRRQQQPEAGGAPGQFPPPPAQSLTPSVNESEAGHSRFPVHQETVGSGPGSLAPTTGFPDWDPNTHAAYTDSPYSYPASAAEGFLTPDFYPPSDPGRQCPYSVGMENPLDTRLYAEPSLPQAGSWRGSGLPSGPPPLPTLATGPSLDTARAHMLALGPQQLLAQDEEGDTLLHLFAARGLRWAAYAAAEMLQVYRRLDIREHKGKTPLLVAAAANQPLIVEDLLNLGAEPNATDHQGRSVLHVAATYGLPGVLSAVINSGVQVDLEARDFEGLTPLHTAILALNVAVHPPDLCFRVLSTQARDRLACVQMLLHMGADHTSQEIKSNKTVLHLAVQAANPTLVQLLLELPQGDLRAFVNMKAHGNTALHMAAALPPGPPQEAIVRRLLAAGADPTLRNLENEQPVHLLRPGPGPEGLRQLLKRSRVAPPGLSS